jgi:hypothetical protein
VRIVGVLLIVGAAITLVLHVLGAPEGLYRWSYQHLLSGLDVPHDPSEGTVEAVRYTSLIGGLLQLVAGLALLGLWAFRDLDAEHRAHRTRFDA